MAPATAALLHQLDRFDHLDRARSQRLDAIDEQLLRMFGLVIDGLSAATVAFTNGDVVSGRKVVTGDVVVDALHAAAEELVNAEVRLLTDGIDRADLTRLVTALRILPELERSGDLVEHIAARASTVLMVQLPSDAVWLLKQMSALAVELWRRAADFFAGGDVADLDQLRRLDDELDDLHVQLCTALARADLSVAAAIEMGLVGRFYERLGDHAVNISRRVEAEESAAAQTD